MATASIAAAPGSATRREGQSGVTTFTFVVTLDQPASSTGFVSWSVTGSGPAAASAADFPGAVVPSGTVVFAPGETSASVTIEVRGDHAVEPDESLTVSLANPSATLTLGTASASATIANDDLAAHADAYILLEGGTLAVPAASGVLVNDEVGAGAIATRTSFAQSGGVALQADGSVDYVPFAGFTGIDTFTYKASDANGTTSDVTVTIHVVPLTPGTPATLDLVELTTEEQIAAIYIAFFGRGADRAGFAFWVDEFADHASQPPAALFANIASSFGISLEAQALYPFLADPSGATDGEIGAFVDAVYQNLFDRLPDAGGRAYWIGQVRDRLADGEFVGTVLVDVIGGAQNSASGQDITTLMSKVAVALHYVDEQQRAGSAWTPADDLLEARALIDAVGADRQSLLGGMAHAEALVQADLADGANQPAIVSGTSTGAVTEKGGVLNGTAGIATATGNLDATDLDSPATFVPQTAVATAFGEFTIDAGGAWSFTLDDSDTAVQGLNAGDTLPERIRVFTADGTQHTVTIAIHGSNDAAVLSSAAASLVESNAVLSAGGTLTISDVDSAAVLVAQVATAGTHGTFKIDASGAWSWTASSAHDEFVAGTTYTDSFAVVSADGTQTSVTVSILGTNDPAVLSPAVASLVETNAVLSTGGTVTIGDVDSASTFVAQVATAGKHGTFKIDAAGAWSWMAVSAHDEFAAGTTYTDSFVATSADGTTTTVTVNILGTNDPALLSPVVVDLVETNAVLSAGGLLTIGDVDSPALFVAQAATAGTYGTFRIDASGAWGYTAHSPHDAFVGGTTYSDSFVVTSADGTTTSLTVNILGTNDPALLSSAVANLVETNAALSAGGTLAISDVDSPATFVALAATAGAYGTFKIDSAGAWSWTASSAHDAFVGGTTYSDSFVVESADGTTTSVIVNVLGTDDPAVPSPPAVVDLTETNAVLISGGTLLISDPDSPSGFVAQTATAGTYGTFKIDAAGAWSYKAFSAHDAFVGGTTYSDSFLVTGTDGTTTSVTVNILGTDDPAALSPAVANLTETNAILMAGGTLSISDPDSATAFVAQAATAGTYGAFSITAGGTWSYKAFSAHDAFVGGTTYSDSFVVESTDGTATSVTVNILGTNDPAALSPVVADLTETNAVLATGGTLAISDPDSPATFVAQAATAGTFGTFKIDASGAWSFTASSALDELAAGTTYSDSFTVASADGTTTSVTVRILGTNDAAVLSAAVANLMETNAALATGGTLAVSDVDNPAAFVVQAATAGTWGTFAITASGDWSYKAYSAHDAFVGGTTYSDSFVVESADGTTTSVTVNILGTNDLAILSPAVANLVETNAVLTAGGSLSISDVDSPATFVVQAATAGTLGTFAIDASGDWKYTAYSTLDVLAGGTTYSDSFVVTSTDGTTTSVTVNILGTDDPAVLLPAVANLVETDAKLATGGTLVASDVDSLTDFVPQAFTLGTWGAFSIAASGAWTYQTTAAHDAFVDGTTYSDSFVVAGSDGSTTTVAVHILGTNDAAVLPPAVANLTETNAALATGGTLSISDVDSPATFVAQAATAGSYGTFTVDASGAWSWTASSAHDEFVDGKTYSDSFVVTSADGTTSSVTVNVRGTNDATVMPPVVADLIETNVVLTADGTLSISDVDSPARVVPQLATAGTYGTFTIEAEGFWTYKASSPHDEFAVGATYTDTFEVTSADGTTTSVTVRILGTNDAAVLSSSVANLVETNAALSAGGTLTISDVDSPATFQVQAATAGLYGTFTIDAAGAWSWTASSAHDAFVAGTTYTDTFSVAAADGTTTSVTVNVLGTNDPAVLTPAVANLTETDAALSTGGTLPISDVDSPATFQAQAATAGTYGTFTIDTAGVWSWTASSAHNEFVAGSTYTDTFGVASADGATTTVTVNVLGTNDAAVITGDVGGAVGEDAIPLASGDLNATDIDSAATFKAQVSAATTYGTFGITADGAWTYVLDNASAAVQALASGQLVHDFVTVQTADGTTQVIDITVAGIDENRFDLTFLVPARGFVIQGDTKGDRAGTSVSSAGDVNGDGFLDLIVGAPDGDDGGAQAGEAYVVFGRASVFGTVGADGRAVIDLTSLAALDGFIIQGDAVFDGAGDSVSSAGDVNGDGYADLIVGATDGDDGGDQAGEAYVVFGRASGFGTTGGDGRATIDLTSLVPSDGFIVQGDATVDLAGFSVSSAGDINGDGFADLIVGAPFGDDGGNAAGEAYVVFGSASGFGTPDGTGRAVIDLTSLAPSVGFIVQGDAADDLAGTSVSSAGDVNGDGYADLIVGAHWGDDGGDKAGEAYVVFGRASGFGTTDGAGRSVIDLASLAPSDGFVIQGDEAGDQTGRSVSSAGDVNGDGIADLIVGAHLGDGGGDAAGEAYVLFGRSSGFGTTDGTGRSVIDLTSLAPSSGFIIQGDSTNDLAGFSVSSAGDVNGDGYADLLVGAWFGDDGGSSAGEAYVVFGRSSGFGTTDGTGRSVIDLTNLAVGDGLIIQGDAADDGAGFSVSSAGDINGDGFADLIVGAPDGDDGGSLAGEAYVLLGGAFGATTVTTGTAAAEILIGGVGNDTLTGGGGADSLRGGAGNDVLSVADLAFRSADGGTGTDTMVLAAGGLTLDLTSRTQAAKISGIERFDITGSGDNTLIIDRLAVLTEAPAGAGAMHVVTVEGNAGDAVSLSNAYWSKAGTVVDGAVTFDRYVSGHAEVRVEQGLLVRQTIDLTFLSPSLGFVIQGDAVLDQAGWSVSSAGDVNGDGHADVIVGAPTGDDGGGNAGEAYVVFGRLSGFGTTVGGRTVIDLTSLASSDGFIVQGDTGNDLAGRAVSSAGDVNGDGFADLIVGAERADGGGGAGEAYVVFGRASGFGTTVGGRTVIDLTTLAPSDGFIVQGDATGDLAGLGVSSAGDVNGDGYADLIVGAPAGDDGGAGAGEAYVVFGGASGFGTTVGGRAVIDLTSLAPSDGFIVQGDAATDEAAGSVSSAGDVNGDGYADLVVGALRGDDGGSDAGEAYVVFGRASGFGTVDGSGRTVVDLTSLAPADGFIIQGDSAVDWAGHDVSSAGDVNGDGYADLIVGARLGDDGGENAGEAYVVFGRASGFGTVDGSGRAVVDLTSLAPADGFIIQGDAAGDGAGWSVSSAGDVNGDGYADLIIGAPGGDDGGGEAGEAYVVFGRASGFGTAVGGRAVIDLTALAPADGFIVQGDSGSDQAGFSVSSAGDVNGDGFADLIVGAPLGDDGGGEAGEAYVLFGGAFGGSTTPVTTTGLATADILIGGLGNDTLTGAGGADSIRGGAGNDKLSVADLGFRSVDGGTGTDTLALAGANLTLDLTNRTQGAKISGIERFDLTGSGNNTLVLDRLAVLNEAPAEAGGTHVITVEGDVGDAVSLLNAQWGKSGTLVEGAVTFDRYVSGNAEVRVEQGLIVRQTIDLTFLSTSQGFIIQGDTAGDTAGWSVSSAGDVNGDGYADLLVGARGGGDGGGDAGEAYVVFGRASGFGTTDDTGRSVIDLTSLAPSDGFIVQGDAAGDSAGYSVSSGGDANGDGYADLIVGAVTGDDGGSDAGEAYVVFGRASGFGTIDGTGRSVIDLTGLAPSDGFIVQGDAAGDNAGWSVSSGGDVNGDGYADLIVGARLGNGGGSAAGEAYVVFGRASAFGTIDGTDRSVLDLTSLAPSDGFIVQGDTPDDVAGWSVSSAGDINGDGYADLIVGAAFGDDGGASAGEAYVVFGRASGFGTTDGTGRSVIDLTSLAPSDGFIVQGDAALDNAGHSVSSVGDVNGDGYADLIVGAPFGDDNGNAAGEAYVVFGRASGFGTTDGTGRSVIDLTSLAPSDGFIVQGDAANDLAGWSVSSAGDMNGDGYADLVVGARFGDDGAGDASEAYVVFGRASGFGTTDGSGRSVLDLTSLAPSDGFIVQGDAAFDNAGHSVSSAGDVNGDGFADLMVGALGGDDGGSAAGEAYVLFGGAFGGSTTPVTTTGMATGDILIGGLGDDTLTGAGGADSIRGGAGDDVLSVADLAFRSVDGGTGSDTLALAGANLTLDLTNRTQAAKISGIERFDLTGSGNNTLVLDRLAVLNEAPAEAGGSHVITVEGDAGDAVSLFNAHWSKAGSVLEGAVTFDRYVSGNAEVRVEQGLTVRQTIDLTFLSTSLGFIIQGDSAVDQAGWGVSSAGDVNGDGFADMIVGAPTGDDGGGNAGEAYIVFGRSSGFGTVGADGRSVIDLASLAPSDGFIVQGDSGNDLMGRSVSSAGDVNGDGFADLIVGARDGDDGGSNAGEAYVVFGRASGFGTTVGGHAVIDLTSLAPSDGFIVQGDQPGDLAGIGVSSAGDVNGDGYADLIVGASDGDDGGGNAGEAYVVFGRSSGFGTTGGDGRAVIDLSSLAPSDGFIVQGDAAGDLAGVSVSSAGDVNGDGYADLMIGAASGDDGGSTAGEAYVVFGRASGFGTTGVDGRAVVDLTSLAAADGFIVQGDAVGDQAGFSVSSAGDVNGDGYADVIVGGNQGDDGGGSAGEAYVVFGRASGFGTVGVDGRAVVDLTSLAASDGFVVQGDTAGDEAGWSVSSAGDVNGDGYADLIVGARNGDDGGGNAGEAYVVFGRASGFGTVGGDGRSVIDLTRLAPADGFVVQGDGASDLAGFSVSSAGDVNGDGFADLMVGASQGDDGGGEAGEAYVLFGGAFGGSTIPVTTTGSTAAEILIGALGDDTLTGAGGADSIRGGAGDDNLSVADLAFRSIDGGTGTDTLALAGAGLTLDLTNRTLAAKISGIERFDLTGTGDNTLAIDRLAVLNETPAEAGGTHVITVEGDSGDAVSLLNPHWSNSGTVVEGTTIFDRYVSGNAEVRVEQGLSVRQVIDLTVLVPSQGFIIQGDGAGDNAGGSVSSAGDVNGDGYADVIVGAQFGDDGAANAGEAYVVYGRSTGFGTTVGGRAVIDLTTLDASDGFIVQGDDSNDNAGYSVSSAGDVNGDGFADLLVGARGGDDGGNAAGEVYVVYGRSTGFGTVGVDGRAVIDLADLSASDGFIVQGDASSDNAGGSVSSAGDVNGDGYADLLVGAPSGDDGGGNAGEAYVVYGRSTGFGTVGVDGRAVIDLASLASSDGFIVQGDESIDLAGWSLSSAGDLNGDGFADVIVGALGGDDGGSGAGEAYVVFGRSSGFGTVGGDGRAVVDLTSLAAADGFILQGDSAGAGAGNSVSSAGDVNGDGYDDLLVGAPNGDGGGSGAGEAYVVFGRSSGFGTVGVDGRAVIDLASLAPADGFIIQGDAASDSAGWSVSSAGDVNGDGHADLIVGAFGGDDGGGNAGEAYVVFGRASGLGTVGVDGRSVIDLTNLSPSDGFIVQGDAAGDSAGGSVSSAGDVNGDGYADLIVGAQFGDDGGNGAGEAYVLFGGAFGGSTAPVTTTGSGAAEILIGGLGDDTLTGAGGADSIRGGAGNDRLSVANLALRSVDGGTGSDTLALAGAGLTLDLTNRTLAAKISGIERFDLTGSGNNTLILDRLAVLNEAPPEAGGTHVVTVEGDAGDAVSLLNAYWVKVGTIIDGAITFDRYASGNAEVRVEQGLIVRQTIDLTFLSPSLGFIIQGDAAEDQTGWTGGVSSAGDVNGDGFADLIVGALGGDGGGTAAGQAYVVFGRSSGFGTTVGGRAVIDLTSLAPSDGFIVQGDTEADLAGNVSSAGDVNGDGYADLIVGAPFGDDGGSLAGEAYVVFGRSSGFGTTVSGRAVIDLTSLAPGDGFIVQGDAAGDTLGQSVSSAGDVNGDGYADLIVGAPEGSDGGSGAGEAYVVFGRSSGFGTVGADGRAVIDLTSLAPAAGFIVQGDAPSDAAGFSVSAAGDVNGDGYGDLIVGAVNGSDGGMLAGEAYVVFGHASGFGTLDASGRSVIDLTSLTPSDGFIVQGDAAFDAAGFSVSSAGDVNGDGFADLIVGAINGDDGGGEAGEAYVVFGRAAGLGTTDGTGRSVIDLASLAPADGFVIQGDASADFAGIGVSSAGDVNGDGYADLIVGASGGNDGGIDAGEAYVVFGRSTGFGMTVSGRLVLDLTSLSPSDGFIVRGDSAGDIAGRSVSSAGDVNDDGFADLIVGAPNGDDGGNFAGEAYVLFGGAFGGSAIPVTTSGSGAAEILIGGLGGDTLTGGGGADSIRGGAGNDKLSVGDLGFRSVDGGTGSDTLVLAGAGLTLDLMNRTQAAKISGIERFDLAGSGDNTLILDRLAVLNEAAAEAGGTHVITVEGDAGDAVSLFNTQWGKAGIVVEGAVTFDRYVSGNAEVRVEQGLLVRQTIDLTFLAPSLGFIIQGDAANDQAGWSVSLAGDVNGDGLADLIVGAREGDDGGGNAGEAYVVFGRASGFGTVGADGRAVIDLTSLGPSDGFVVQGDAAGDQAGYSVSSAGDVNGDGYADLIVGAQNGDDGGAAAGEAYVVFGRASGFGTAGGDGRAVIDLTSLASSDGFIVQGDSASDFAGWSVSSAGDMNGDGFADLIVGAIGGDDGGGAAGEAYVVFGRGSGFGTVGVDGRAVIDLTSLAPSAGFIVQGDAADDQAAWSVSSAGDVNGDGFADLVVGVRDGDDGGGSAGEAYVVFGRASGFGTVDGSSRSVIDLTSLASSDGFIVQGDAAGDEAGYSVSSAGDVNGDGHADLIVGARLGEDGGGFAGEAYVVFGRSSGFGTVGVDGRSVIDLTSLASSDGFIVQGDGMNDQAGTSVSSAGDVNGDGFADLIVGAARGDNGGNFAGEAYVVFGRSSGFGTVGVDGRSVIDLTSLAPSAGFIVQGDGMNDQVGTSVSSAGDVNGDGFADLIVGAPFGDDGGNNAGEAYVLFGGAFGGSTIPVTTTGSGAAEILIGGLGNDTLTGAGGADSIRGGAGDDVLSVADLAFRSVDGGTGSDTLAVAGAGLTLDLLNRTQAAKISGIERFDLTGSGDNTLVLDRLAVLNEAPAESGGTHVITVEGDAGDAVSLFNAQWGKSGIVVEGGVTFDRYVNGNAEVRVEQGLVVRQTIDLTFLGTSQGFIIQGDAAFDLAGSSVSTAGDVNGDGYADLIIGAPFGDDGGALAGEAYVVFGRASGFGSVGLDGRAVIDLTSLAPSDGFIVQGDVLADEAGSSVSTAGDVNGDGYADLIVGAPAGDDGGAFAGEAYVVFGRASGFGTVGGDGRSVIDLTSLASSDGFIVVGEDANDAAGTSVSTAGDVNGDGYDDLIVGAPGADDGDFDAGEAYVVFGRAGGLGIVGGDGRAVIDLTNLDSKAGFLIQGDAELDDAGWSVSSAGDVNGDGFADLIVGADAGDDGGNAAGEAYVVFGRASGFGTVGGDGRSVIDLASLAVSDGFIVQGDTAVDAAGTSVRSAGDVNGDGFADLIVGAPFGDDGGSNAGEAYVVFGRGSGFGTVGVDGRAVIDLTSLAAADGFIVRGDASDDLAGYSVSSAGDVNGDGYADLIVGAPDGDDGGSLAGEAYVVFGRASGFGTVAVDGRSVIDLTNLAPSDGFIVRGDAVSDGVGVSVSSAGDVNSDGYADLIVGAQFGDDGGSDAGEAYVLFGGAFGGSTTAVTTSGTTAPEILIGGLGGDTLSGGGGADSIRGGAGNDVITVPDLVFLSVDGGSGVDRLVLTGAGQTFDFTTLADSKVAGIERLDITGSGDNALTLALRDVLRLSDTADPAFTAAATINALVVDGNAGDSLDLVDYDPDGALPAPPILWHLFASDVGLDGSAGGAYDLYELELAGVRVAAVAVDADITVS